MKRLAEGGEKKEGVSAISSRDNPWASLHAADHSPLFTSLRSSTASLPSNQFGREDQRRALPSSIYTPSVRWIRYLTVNFLFVQTVTVCLWVAVRPIIPFDVEKYPNRKNKRRPKILFFTCLTIKDFEMVSNWSDKNDLTSFGSVESILNTKMAPNKLKNIISHQRMYTVAYIS